MPINKNTSYGQVNISDDAIASLVGSVVIECYGVVGMTSKKPIKDGYCALLKKENFSKGVIIKSDNNIINIDLYIVASIGVKLSEVVISIQQRVKYTLEKTLNIDINTINVYVEGIGTSE